MKLDIALSIRTARKIEFFDERVLHRKSAVFPLKNPMIVLFRCFVHTKRDIKPRKLVELVDTSAHEQRFLQKTLWNSSLRYRIDLHGVEEIEIWASGVVMGRHGFNFFFVIHVDQTCGACRHTPPISSAHSWQPRDAHDDNTVSQ